MACSPSMGVGWKDTQEYSQNPLVSHLSQDSERQGQWETCLKN